MLIHSCKFSFVAILIAITALPLAIQTPESTEDLKPAMTSLAVSVEAEVEINNEDDLDFNQNSEQLEQDMGFFAESNAFEDDPSILPAREVILDEHLDLGGTSLYVHAAGVEQR